MIIFTKIKKEISGVIIHGVKIIVWPIINLLRVDSEWAVIQLDERGFAVATVVPALPDKTTIDIRALYGDLKSKPGSIRILGRDITSQDIDNLICAKFLFKG